MKRNASTARWDAELDSGLCDPYNNAELTLTLKLGFRQINPAGEAASGTYPDYGNAQAPARKIVRWTDSAWAAWMNDFAASAQRYWHGKFWLVNNFPELEFEHAGTRYRPNVWCKFALRASDVRTGLHHYVIDVVRLDASEPWFGSHARLYDDRDLRAVPKGRDSNGKPIMQQAHVHEVGHLLGLEHVDVGKPHCPALSNTDAVACYGVEDRDQYSVMGAGMQMRLANAAPWRTAIQKITGKGRFPAPGDWAARTVHHYPRTLAEAAANASITQRPHRA